SAQIMPQSRLAYRFSVVYLALFSLATQIAGGLLLFPGFSFPPLGTVRPMRDITYWLGTHVFHVSTLDYAGVSADTPFHWVQLAWIAVVAAIIAIVSVRLKPDTTGPVSVRLKVDTTGPASVRLKADTAGASGASVVS